MVYTLLWLSNFHVFVLFMFSGPFFHIIALPRQHANEPTIHHISRQIEEKDFCSWVIFRSLRRLFSFHLKFIRYKLGTFSSFFSFCYSSSSPPSSSLVTALTSIIVKVPESFHQGYTGSTVEHTASSKVSIFLDVLMINPHAPKH